ncbi:MAG: PocR ligand-binding domain-containing protein [Lachnospiraceae bacterium]
MQPLLYSFVDKETLDSMVDTFYSCMHLPIQIIEEHGEFLAASGSMEEFCHCFQKYLSEDDTCEKMHIRASKRAITLGEPYIFSCHANLNHIVFPLISKHTFLGSVLVGPFLMDAPDSILLSDISKRYCIPTDETLDLYDELKDVPIVLPAMVNHISRLLFFLFANLISDSKEELKNNNKKLLQQSRINESIQRYKEIDANTDSYPYEQEKELITKVKTGNVNEANAVLNNLLGYVLFSKGNSLEIVKARALELCSLLSRAAIESGAPTDNILKLSNHFLKNIQQISTMDMLCYKLQEIVETFTESMFNSKPSKNNELIKKAMIYISQHFNTPLTLEDVASQVHLHPSYFSTMFKQSTGSTFKEYLNMVRIEESKRLLSNTDFSIIDIAVAIGFEDQSYFSKVFKKYTGLTPKQFR